MPIVTLTTDFGTKDFYTGVLKGTIIKEAGSIDIVDITHNIDPYNISEAAFIVKNAYHHFPKKTIHLVSVNDPFAKETRCLLIKYDDHYFLGFDNGIFSLIFEKPHDEIVELKNVGASGTTSTFPSKDVFAKAIGQMAKEKPVEKIGSRIHEFRKRTEIVPVIQEKLIRGTVIYIDGFQNAIVNITRDLFEKVRSGRQFTISFKRNERIDAISQYYYDVAEGEKLCLFNSSGYLEIAVNAGKGSSLLGLNTGDTVQIDFT